MAASINIFSSQRPTSLITAAVAVAVIGDRLLLCGAGQYTELGTLVRAITRLASSLDVLIIDAEEVTPTLSDWSVLCTGNAMSAAQATLAVGTVDLSPHNNVLLTCDWQYGMVGVCRQLDIDTSCGSAVIDLLNIDDVWKSVTPNVGDIWIYDGVASRRLLPDKSAGNLALPEDADSGCIWGFLAPTPSDTSMFAASFSSKFGRISSLRPNKLPDRYKDDSKAEDKQHVSGRRSSRLLTVRCREQ